MPHASRLPRVAALVLTSSLALLAPTAVHAGFLEQLFGVPGSAPNPPAEQSREPAVAETAAPPHAHRETARKKHVASVAEWKPRASKLQMPTPLMADKTLRPGDAVMSKDGLKIYAGPVADRHEDSQFVAVARANISSARREALIAMLPAMQQRPDTVSIGRSVAAAKRLR